MSSSLTQHCNDLLARFSLGVMFRWLVAMGSPGAGRSPAFCRRQE